MDLQTVIIQPAKKYFKKVPLFGGLVNCTFTNHKYAIGELLSTLLFSFLPILIAYIVSYLGDHSTKFWPSINTNLQNGELFIYVTSLLAPVFFIVMKKRMSEEVFPSKVTHILVYWGIVGIAALVFALKRVGFTFDIISISILQKLVFYTAMVLFYLVLVYNNSLLPNPSSAMQAEEEDFAKSVHKHRGGQ